VSLGQVWGGSPPSPPSRLSLAGEHERVPPPEAAVARGVEPPEGRSLLIVLGITILRIVRNVGRNSQSLPPRVRYEEVPKWEEGARRQAHSAAPGLVLRLR